MTPIDRDRFDGVILDLDGVITDTASIHARAWHAVFDDLLSQRCDAGLAPFSAFEPTTDYPRLIDGRPRIDGVRAFLHSRGIALPEESDDPKYPLASVAAIASTKNERFLELLRRDGPGVFEGAVWAVRRWRERGMRVGIVSASRNCAEILRRAKLEHLFETRVDGETARALGLAGKPAPDTFLEAARRLEAPPSRLVVIEDAVPGVEAGASGGFGLVIGVDRLGVGPELRAHGAHQVVTDVADLEREPLDQN